MRWKKRSAVIRYKSRLSSCVEQSWILGSLSFCWGLSSAGVGHLIVVLGLSKKGSLVVCWDVSVCEGLNTDVCLLGSPGLSPVIWAIFLFFLRCSMICCLSVSVSVYSLTGCLALICCQMYFHLGVFSDLFCWSVK